MSSDFGPRLFRTGDFERQSVISDGDFGRCVVRSSPKSPTVCIYIYIFYDKKVSNDFDICHLYIYMDEHIPQPAQYFGPILIQCWTTVYDVGPTLDQHRANVLCLLGHLFVKCNDFYYVNKIPVGLSVCL